MIIELVDEAVQAGAREARACEVLGIADRTLGRWRADGGGEDARAGAGKAPAHKLTDAERAAVRESAHAPEHRDLSPRQIVPLLADTGVYIASESTFYRILAEEGELAHRGRARPPKARKPDEHVARAPNEVWCWDITYLRTEVRSVFFYLYMAVDVYSRKIVGWEVCPEESGECSSRFIQVAIKAEPVDPGKLALHADNGGPMKASTMLATLQRLGVIASFSRPSVSDDNPYAEALFRTLKYRPGYPTKPFATIEDATTWVAGFVQWYNLQHLHSAIRYITPVDRHEGRDTAILAQRHRLYTAACESTPRRWTGDTRDWNPVGDVYLNPVKHEVRVQPLATPVS